MRHGYVKALYAMSVISVLTLIRHTRLAYRQAQAARVEAEAALQACTTSVSFVAHDLKNPLLIIRGYAQLARPLVEQLGTAERERLLEALAHIDKASIAIEHMAQDILASYDVQHPAVTRHWRQTDLVALAGEAASAYQRISPLHRIQFYTAEATLEGYWNAPDLERVLNNLLSNAVKYSPSGGDIMLAASRNGDEAVLQIEDHGMGIPKQDLPHIFELFNRGTNVAGIKGLGLGLTGTSRIVAEHGGRITVDSSEGMGTQFTITLPLHTHENIYTNSSST